MPHYADRPDQLLSPDQLKQMSGLDFLRGIAEGRLPQPPICRSLSFRLVEVTEGRAVFEGTPDFASYNPLGAVHGGWFGAILDSCMACSVQSRLPRGTGYTTLEYRVNILRPVFEAGEVLRAEGAALHVGQRTGAAEGKLVGVDSGKLYAFGTTTCLVMAL